MRSIFVTYSSRDKTEFENLRSALEKRLTGVTITYDTKTIKPGQNIPAELRDQIADAELCVFVATSNSLSSPWCLAELGAFWGNGKRIIPFIPAKAEGETLDTARAPYLDLNNTHSTGRHEELIAAITHHLSAETITTTLSRFGIELENAIGPMKATLTQVFEKLQVMGPFDESNMFGQRFLHFTREKEVIAHETLDRLRVSVEAFQKEDKKVRVLLDSGTTVYQLFPRLAEQKMQPWIRETFLATNNIPGMIELLRHAREDETDRYSKLAFTTRVSPGELFPVFWAVLPEDSEQGSSGADPCEEFWGRWEGDDRVTIGVTTSNYAKADGLTLLARNKKHIRVKEWIMKASDVLFVLLPMGKMLNATADELNEAISSPSEHDDDRLYAEVPVICQKVHLITTRRDSTDVFGEYSSWLRDHQQQRAGVASSQGANIDIISADFTLRDFAPSRAQQIAFDVPHEKSLPPDAARRMREFLSSRGRRPGGDY